MTLREANANALDDMRRRLVRLGVTGAPAATFTVFVDVDAERRRQTVIEQLRADPRVASVT